MERRSRNFVQEEKNLAAETGQDDLNLVQRAIAGRLEAFDGLVIRHQDRIFGVVLRLVGGDRERAMDLTQETFLRAWKGLPSFKGGSTFFTWLYRIARNVVTSQARFDAARPRLGFTLDGRDGGEKVTHLEPEAPAPAPSARLIASEEQELVLACIDALPFEFREVVVLRDMEDRSYEEIAEILVIPIGTVRSRLHRARMELKERLRKVLDPAG